MRMCVSFIIVCISVFWTVAAVPTPQLDVTSTDSLSYLIKYGYLTPQNPQTGALRTEESVSYALKRLQRMGGVNETGKLDEATKTLMTMRRCGVPDNVGMGIGARRKRYALQGSKWAKKDLTYRTSSYPRGLPTQQVDDQVYRSLEIWAKVTPLTFTKKDYGKVDLDIKFARRSHGDGNPFDGRGRTLAHAFFPQYGGAAHFDDEEPWSIEVPDGVNLFQVAAHEFGHSLGLAHSDVSTALMAPFYRGYQKYFELSRDDIGAIQELYGTQVSNKPIKPPTRDPTLRVPKICLDSTVDAVARLTDGLTYLFKGKHYYRLNGYGIDPGYPREISWDWAGLEGPIDAVVHWDNGFTYFFKGEFYYKFHNFRLIYAKLITEGFRGIPNDVDAVFVWGGNGKAYFFKGNEYWRYTDRKVDFGYPKPLTVWRGLPAKINAAFKWRNGRTYFFSGENYYRFHDNKFKVDEGYPRNIGNWWLGCPDKTDNLHQGGTEDSIMRQHTPSFESDVNQDDELLLVTQADDNTSDQPISASMNLKINLFILIFPLFMNLGS